MEEKEIYFECDDKWLGGTLDCWNLLELILGTVGKFELLINNLWDIFGKRKTLLYQKLTEDLV